MLLSRKFTMPKLRDDSSFISIIKAGLIEMGATALFLFFTIGTITSGCHAKDVAQSSGHPISLAGAEAGSCALNVGNVGNIAFAFGLSIFVLVYATAALTGGHINPAVTLGLLVAGRICALRALVYTLCQMLGAAIGAGLVKAIDPSGFYAAAGGVDKVPHWMAFEAAWGMEAILTFALVFMVFAATDNFHAMTTAHLPVLAPLAIGLTVYLCHLVAVPLDGCSINPARSFGSAIVANQWYSHWVFWVGPYTGAIFAAYVYEAVFKHVDESVSTIQDHSLVIIKAPTDQDLEAGNFKVGGQIGTGGEFPHVAQPGPEQGPGMPAQTVG